MQARAIFEAAAKVQAKGIKVRPEIMIPLVGFPRELKLQIEIVRRVARDVAKDKNRKFNYLVGTMIEIPRAALVADQIAQDAEFFSFGTNDLTQTTLGMSRDDSGSFLPAYAELDIIDANPFASIDQKGVGRLMETTRDLGRKTWPDIKLGICGEHGRSEEHTSELQSPCNLVCRLLLEKKKTPSRAAAPTPLRLDSALSAPSDARLFPLTFPPRLSPLRMATLQRFSRSARVLRAPPAA